MDDNFKRETQRLAKDAQRLAERRKTTEIPTVRDVPADIKLRKCPRCSGSTVTLDDCCATCGLDIRMW